MLNRKERTKKIAVIYRHEDSSSITGRIVDRLEARFPNSIFLDVQAKRGRDYRAQSESCLKGCKVALIIIGKKWLEITNESGQRRIDESDDLMRKEIEIALGRNDDIHVVPLLVEEARMPPEKSLPKSIAQLRFIKATTIHHEFFKAEMEAVIRELDEKLHGRFIRILHDWQDRSKPITNILGLSVVYLSILLVTVLLLVLLSYVMGSLPSSPWRYWP